MNYGIHGLKGTARKDESRSKAEMCISGGRNREYLPGMLDIIYYLSH